MACAMILSLFAGCSSPDFLTKADKLYERYHSEMQAVDQYNFQITADVVLNQDNFRAISDLRNSSDKQFMNRRERFTIDGVYDRSTKTMQASIGVSGTRGELELDAKPFTTIKVSDTNVFIDAKTAYEELAKLFNVKAEYPNKEDYIRFDIGEAANVLWSGDPVGENVAPSFIAAFANVANEYVKNNATFEKEKNHAAYTVVDMTPSLNNSNMLNALYENHMDASDSIGGIVDAAIPDTVKEMILDETEETRTQIEEGEIDDPMIIMNPAIDICNLFDKLEMLDRFSTDDISLLQKEFINNFDTYELVQQYKSAIDLSEDGYTKTISYVLGTVHNSESAIPLISVDISFTMNPTVPSAIEIPQKSVAAENALNAVYHNFLVEMNNEEEEEPEEEEDQVLQPEKEDAEDSEEEEKEPEEEPFERMLEEDTYVVSISDSSSDGNFSAGKINGVDIYGATVSMTIDGVTLKDLTPAGQEEGSEEFIMQAASSFTTNDELQASVVHQISEFPAGYKSVYKDKDALIETKLAYASTDVNKGSFTSDNWHYRIKENDATGIKELYMVRIDNENLVENLMLKTPDSDILNEFLSFIAPKADRYVPAIPEEQETAPSPTPWVDQSTTAQQGTAQNNQGTQSGNTPAGGYVTATPAPQPGVNGSSSGGGSSSNGSGSNNGSGQATASPSPSAGRDTFSRTNYEGRSLWAISSTNNTITAYGNKETQGDYSLIEYTSFGTVAGCYSYINNQMISYSDTIADHYDSDSALEEDRINLPLSIRLDSADSNTASTSDYKTANGYTYKTATFKESGKDKAILIGVKKHDDKTIETILIDVDGGQSALDNFINILSK